MTREQSEMTLMDTSDMIEGSEATASEGFLLDNLHCLTRRLMTYSNPHD